MHSEAKLARLLLLCFYYCYTFGNASQRWSSLTPAESIHSVQNPKCSGIRINERFDCYSEPGATQSKCQLRGCCWAPAPKNVPECFYPLNYGHYKVGNISSTKNKQVFNLVHSGSTGSPYNDLNNLQVVVIQETESRLRIRILDPVNQRWEPPIALSPPNSMLNSSLFDVSYQKEPFGLKVTRRSDQLTLFDTILPEAPLRFSDQFIELSAKVGVWKGYGLGEQRRSFMHNLRKWNSQAFWSRDQPPTPDANLYGVHNFFLGLSDNGTAYGIFLLNSNAQEVAYQPLPAITYRTIGGILDFFIFVGPTAKDVVQQYHLLIGKPMMPPFWSLGFHLSRYGVRNTTQLRDINKRNRNAQIPFDVQWSDIDYMDRYLDFTYDKVNYAGLPGLIDEIHNNKMKYVVILDPGISSERPGHYFPFDEGLRQGIFVNISDKVLHPLIGKVWPGLTAYPDFSNPAATDFWFNMTGQLYKELKYDGLWIDMNEPSNFYDGSLDGCPGDKWDHPPYVPKVTDISLMKKTICPSARHYKNVSHYNIHSMYGYFEAKSTNYALRKLKPTKRPFILTRSSFAGSGGYTFHWTGDNQANFMNMYYSISQVLNFNLFGISLVGADICGFIFDSNEELCTRWMQLGAFYPFMRNHADKNSREQDPAIWSKPALDAMRNVLLIRYACLPYLYTLFYRSVVNGSTVARPLFFEFPEDITTHAIDKQFLLGSALLVSPVLMNNTRDVHAYFPDAIWYNLHNGSRIPVRHQFAFLPAPLDTINIHIRGGSIVATLPPALNTVDLRKGAFNLAVCFNDNATASGELYWDDGETGDPKTGANANLIKFKADAKSRQLVSRPVFANFKTEPMILGRLTLAGISKTPNKLTVNGINVKFHYNRNIEVLSTEPFKQDMTKTIVVTWSYDGFSSD